MCGEDQSSMSFFVAGAIFGEVGMSPFRGGATCPAILGDSRSAQSQSFQKPSTEELALN